mmetsp:Transcript_11281/g.16671  ORF Transcript_11281/g.16671 Transcript_11281/m.16671 type:complete len:129 (+) Transcript_11281:966-1352(+)
MISILIALVVIFRIGFAYNRISSSRCACVWWNVSVIQFAVLLLIFFVLLLIKLDFPAFGFLGPGQVEQLDRMYFIYCFIPILLMEVIVIMYYLMRAFTRKVRTEVLKNPFTFFAGEVTLTDDMESHIV